jgi:hypothetical protein
MFVGVVRGTASAGGCEHREEKVSLVVSDTTLTLEVLLPAG